MKRTFYHFTFENGGRITAVVEPSANDTGSKDPNAYYKVGLSLCSPSEHQYNRKKGNAIAAGRLDKANQGHPPRLSFGFQIQGDFADLDHNLQQDLVLSGARGTIERHGPRWAISALEQSL